MNVTHCSACNKVKTSTGSFCKRCQMIKYKYRYNPADVHRTLVDQLGKCGICGELPSKGRSLAVDHNHETMEFRGLLCTRCNMGLGLFSNQTILSNAIRYLIQPLPKMRVVDPKVRAVVPNDIIAKVLGDINFPTMRSKARFIASKTGLSEEAAMSRIRRGSILCWPENDTDTPDTP